MAGRSTAGHFAHAAAAVDWDRRRSPADTPRRASRVRPPASLKWHCHHAVGIVGAPVDLR
jgi:hypothetical protein